MIGGGEEEIGIELELNVEVEKDGLRKEIERSEDEIGMLEESEIGEEIGIGEVIGRKGRIVLIDEKENIGKKKILKVLSIFNKGGLIGVLRVKVREDLRRKKRRIEEKLMKVLREKKWIVISEGDEVKCVDWGVIGRVRRKRE